MDIASAIADGEVNGGDIGEKGCVNEESGRAIAAGRDEESRAMGWGPSGVVCMEVLAYGCDETEPRLANEGFVWIMIEGVRPTKDLVVGM
jgi:hypothetical protein